LHEKAPGPIDRLVLSAITKRAALSMPVRTTSSRSMLQPTLTGRVASPGTPTTSFWMTTASPIRVALTSANRAARLGGQTSGKKKNGARTQSHFSH
jgi:hypothetical protein